MGARMLCLFGALAPIEPRSHVLLFRHQADRNRDADWRNAPNDKRPGVRTYETKELLNRSRRRKPRSPSGLILRGRENPSWPFSSGPSSLFAGL